ncbi:hypothetical protein JCM10908_004661 [Rhodotorula pacifica]|uniref:ubiquitin carboxyl-terminal hydrolase n=1 Tax=Rhodotorula pacifica TaxID=1495444 RepID=UPI0031733159
MFWRSIPRATEVLGSSRASPPPEEPSSPPRPARSPRPLRPARPDVTRSTPSEASPKESERAPRGQKSQLSLKKSNTRLRRAAQEVMDRNREDQPTSFSDVVEQVMSHPDKTSRFQKGLKRTKSVVSLFRRNRETRNESEEEGEGDTGLAHSEVHTRCGSRQRHRPSSYGSSLDASSVLSESSGLDQSPREDRFGPTSVTAPSPALVGYMSPPRTPGPSVAEPSRRTIDARAAARPPLKNQSSKTLPSAHSFGGSKANLLPASQLTSPGGTHASPRRPLGSAVTGLVNLGNSCYLASVVQALLATPPLERFFLDDDYAREINTANRLGSGGELAESFAQVGKVAASGEYRSLSPAYLRDALARWASQYAEPTQQDAHECLLSLLDGLHEDLNLVLRPPPPVAASTKREMALQQLPEVVAADMVWKEYRDRQDSVIVDFFHGQVRNRMECLRCHTTSSTFHALQTLSLALPPIRARQVPTLQECIANYLQEEILRGENAWRCPACETPQVASKRVSIARLPQFLYVHARRFAYNAPKLTTAVTFPLSGLELGGLLPPMALASPSPYELNVPHEQGTSYELYAAVCHHGEDGSGHYTTLVRREEDARAGGDSEARWYEIDDETVVPLSTSDAFDDALLRAEQSAYLLFYRISSNDVFP